MSTVLWLVSLPFRIVGTVLVLAAFASGFWDLYLSVTGEDGMVITPLGELWYRLSADSLNLLRAGIQRGLHPVIWDPGVQFFLNLPAWLALLILATLILLVAQLIYRPR